ncbi:TPA: acetoacetate decarboxylase family protein [Bacillus cereus]|nr:acetoacetate decarboxylase family protein [Bacillus cereus]
MNMQGFTLPLSPNGTSTLIEAPPWGFGGDSLEVSFEVDLQMFCRFLPEPFELSSQPGLISVTFVDMTSLGNPELAYANPERTQYRECLIKMHCKFKDQEGWFVPLSWVDKDFSLLRGFIQGFGKKLGNIHLTKFHDLNPLIGSKEAGKKMKAICESFNGLHIEAGITLEQEVTEDIYAGNSMFVIRHYPDIEDPTQLLVHEVSELVVRNVRKESIWKGNGEISIYGNKTDEYLQLLQPKKVVQARIFSEGFELLGGKVLHRYQKQMSM